MTIQAMSAAAVLAFAPLAAYQTTVLHGQEITLHLDQVSDYFRLTYLEEPYNYDAPKEKWDNYVRSYARTNRGVVCLLQEGDKIIGAAIGTHLKEAPEKYRMGFANNPEYLESHFYLGELAITQGYRHQDLGTHLFKTLESSLHGYAGICLWQLEGNRTPEADAFYTKMGFELRSDIKFQEIWKNKQDTERTPHPMVCWMKSL